MKKHSQKWILLLYLVSSALSISILCDRSASIFRQLYIQMRYGFSISVILIFFIILAIFQIKKDQYKNLFLFTAILLFFSMSLAGVWASGKSEPTMINGLIPIVDGENYYTDALRWLNGGSFSAYTAKRPIFVAFLTTLAKISGQSIQIMQAFLMSLMAISCFFAIKEIYKKLNPFGTTLFLILTFFYTRQYVGCFLTETIGLIFGLSGFALLITSSNMEKWTFYLSIFLISLALIARAGTFFILPFLLWWIYKMQINKKQRWKKVIRAFSCMLFAFLLNGLIAWHFGSGENIPFSNFAYILYGLARGGTGWSQIMTDHPELFILDENQLTKEIWSLVLQLIRQNPQNLVSGMLKQYVYFVDFSYQTKSVFSFMSSGTTSIFIATQYLLYLASLAGLFSLVKREKTFTSLILFSLIGIMISVPFVPVQDTLYMRAYAATIPFIIFIPSLGVDFITRKIPSTVSLLEEDKNIGFYSFIVLMLISTFIIPFFIHGKKISSTIKKLDCEGNQENIIFSINENSSIRVHAESEFFLDWAPDFHWSRFYQNIRTYSFSDFVDPLSELDPPFELRVGINLLNNEDVYVIFPGGNFIDESGIYEICAVGQQYSYSPWMRELAKLYFVQDHQILRVQ